MRVCRKNSHRLERHQQTQIQAACGGNLATSGSDLHTVIGAIARLLIPGPNPMTWGKTAIIGIAGSFFGGIIASVLGLEDLFATLIQVGSAATIILYLERR